MKTKCIIVEDEPLAQEVIETYLSCIPDMQLAGKFDNALKAFQFLQNNKIDLMFLDIQMPQLNGIDFLKTMKNPPPVIFTTAFRDYAIVGFDLNIIDYLLKPISIERFLKAIDKYYRLAQTKASPIQIETAEVNKGDNYIYVLSNRKQVKVFLEDILYIESMKDYVVINKIDQKIITKSTLNYFEKTLPAGSFLRIHRSYIVAVNKIVTISKSSVEIGKKELVIGKQYKNSVMASLGVKV